VLAPLAESDAGGSDAGAEGKIGVAIRKKDEIYAHDEEKDTPIVSEVTAKKLWLMNDNVLCHSRKG
jgi:hypothetical protein